MTYQITIIPSDNSISVNGEALQFDFVKPEGIHAIQWLDDTGEIEFTDNRPNRAATWEADVKPYYTMWTAEKTRRDLEAKAAAEAEANKPMSEKAQGLQMTKREFLKLIMGLTAQTEGMTPITYSQIEAYVASTDDMTRMEWIECTYVERSHPLLDTVSASFDISSEMLDIMFVNKDELLRKIDAGEPLHEEHQA